MQESNQLNQLNLHWIIVMMELEKKKKQEIRNAGMELIFGRGGKMVAVNTRYLFLHIKIDIK